MARTILALALLATASAFAPAAPKAKSAVSLNAKSTALPFLEQPAKLDGSMAGDVGFDPLGLSNIDDVGVDLYWMREAELKHCRVAMLAAAGFFWQEVMGSLPGMVDSAGKCQTDVFWDVWAEKPQIIASALPAIFIVEVISWITINKGRETGLREAGDYMFNPLKFQGGELEMKEVANGRLAMFASVGMILQGMVTHDSAFTNLATGLQ
mmetsp:Transcript_4647/g.10948  ORF Transcript_4647/g.10948 Transcript_4647/m.10948 type:complete len:210 (+) Transcript_4647:58-687(+)